MLLLMDTGTLADVGAQHCLNNINKMQEKSYLLYNIYSDITFRTILQYFCMQLPESKGQYDMKLLKK